MNAASTPDRRSFLRLAVAGAAADLAWPRQLDALARRLAPTDQDLWSVVRAGYLIPEDRIYLNVGTLGPQPRVVVDAVVEHTRRVAMTYPPAIDWNALKDQLGDFLNGDPAGFVFPRNTTEGMSFVANGLELAPGDEVLTSDREHIGGVSGWELLAARRGVSLRHVQLPAPEAPADEIVARFERALTPRTRVVSLSHVLFTNGAVMPVREIAELCRRRGIISVIDGAHPPGMMRVDLRAIGADFYATSPHKWLCAAQGSGLLYIAEPWREQLWPTLASGGWDDRSLGAHRLNHMGTLDESRLAGLTAAVAFQQAIGVDLIEARVRELRSTLIGLLQASARIRLRSTADAGAGMVSFTVDGIESAALQQRLASAANVRTRLISEHGLGWLRLSPHIYNTVQELEQVTSLI